MMIARYLQFMDIFSAGNDLRLIAKYRKLGAKTKRWIGIVVFGMVALISNNVSAAPVVVGSVNPDTMEVTIFKDLLVKKFQDGTPINNIYGRYFNKTKEFLMVRAGKSAEGYCQTDAFRLVPLTGNRLAIAAENPNLPWDGIGKIITIKKCFSGSCSGYCQVLGNPDTIDTDDYICNCTSASGPCENTLNQFYKLDEIVWQGPTI